jgi:hypothetical protein
MYDIGLYKGWSYEFVQFRVKRAEADKYIKQLDKDF